MQIYEIKNALEKVNGNRKIMVEHDDCLIPIHSIYIDTETNEVILSKQRLYNECDECIYGDNNRIDCPDDPDAPYETHCEFIPKGKIILHDH